MFHYKNAYNTVYWLSEDGSGHVLLFCPKVKGVCACIFLLVDSFVEPLCLEEKS